MSLKTIVPIQISTDKLHNYLETLENGAEIQLEYLPVFNKLICGLERKKMIVVGSRPSEGKSMFCLQMGYELSKTFKVLYISLEMTVEEAMFRLMCYEQEISNTTFYHGNENWKEDLKSFTEKVKRENRRLIISEEYGRSWDEINNVMVSLSNNKPDLIILDYVQCISTKGKKMEAIEDYIKKFRSLAIDNNFCFVVCSQINRQNISDNKEPTMEGLKNTGSLEEHGDKVILLYYPCKRSPELPSDEFKIIVPKNKNGMTGYVKCKIKPEIYKIYEEVKESQYDVAGLNQQLKNWQDK